MYLYNAFKFKFFGTCKIKINIFSLMCVLYKVTWITLTFNLVLFVTGEVSNKVLTFVFQGNSQNVTLIGATLEVGSLCSMSFIRQ